MTPFVKRRDDAPDGLFAAEAAGLEWLRVPGGAPVVRVVGWTPTSVLFGGGYAQQAVQTARAYL